MMAGKLKERKLEDDLQEAFRMFDQDGDGEEMVLFLKFKTLFLKHSISSYFVSFA